MKFVNAGTAESTQEAVEFADGLVVINRSARVRVVGGGVIGSPHGTRVFLLPRRQAEPGSEVEITDLVSRVEWVHRAGEIPAVNLTLLIAAADVFAERLATVQGDRKTSLVDAFDQDNPLRR